MGYLQDLLKDEDFTGDYITSHESPPATTPPPPPPPTDLNGDFLSEVAIRSGVMTIIYIIIIGIGAGLAFWISKSKLSWGRSIIGFMVAFLVAWLGGSTIGLYLFVTDNFSNYVLKVFSQGFLIALIAAATGTFYGRKKAKESVVCETSHHNSYGELCTTASSTDTENTVKDKIERVSNFDKQRMNRAQRNVIVTTLFSVTVISGLWIFVIIPLILIYQDTFTLEKILTVFPYKVFWIPMLFLVGSLVSAMYIRAGAIQDQHSK